MRSDEIRIGTRGSALALVQARLAAAALESDGRATRLVLVQTEGDTRAPDTAWGEGAFVKAIERALLDGRVDLAVHSAKDVPTDEHQRLRVGGYLPRGDARDALVARDPSVGSLADLPPGARVGTDSPRRTAFLRAHRPDLQVHPLHGNVDTRLDRLAAGGSDALILACAGLDRLGRGAAITERLVVDVLPPAPGQGAIALQIRRDDARMLALTAVVDDPATRTAVESERAFLRAAGGGCRSPIGAFAEVRGRELSLLGGRAAPDGGHRRIGRRSGPAADWEAIAEELQRELWASAAGVEAPA